MYVDVSNWDSREDNETHLKSTGTSSGWSVEHVI